MPKTANVVKAPRATRVACRSYDINTAAGLFEALGGDKAVARELGVPATEPRRWAISGCIPPGWHLRLYAKTLLLEKTRQWSQKNSADKRTNLSKFPTYSQ